MPQTLFDKIWESHVIEDFGDGWALLHIDRLLIHDLGGAPALNELKRRGLKVRNPELVFATPDHAVSSAPGRTGETFPEGAQLWSGLRKMTREAGIRLFDLGEDGQGIVHVMGPELGLVLPGATLICGDSHTCTNGGMGALAFGVGSTECVHALATQTIRQRKPRRMRIRLDGALGQGVTPKDVILHVIGKFGAAAGVEHSIEYAGSAIRQMDIDGRLTICNLSVEMGAKSGIVAPDDKTFAYLAGRPFAPGGKVLEQALLHWRSLASDDDAAFDRDETVNVAEVSPTITWGTSPQHAIAIDDMIPDPSTESDLDARATMRAALDYMGLEAGRSIAGTKVDWVFIGSCTNSRLSDLRDAARFAKDRRVDARVTAWVVPGSLAVKRQAEAEGLDRIFRNAGFQWREPGCSMCVAANGERIPPGARCVSTTNRNFVGRQGPHARTHLASPAMAVAAAVTGAISDVRCL
ncbi:3-isopropylmalate dehydratase large subunit [Bradyrhizobium sp. LHD-71]|uniref:3-isopropylmalate dehydratase large subunit n=1 Tax=Bradyrhizobium sp. LHD-71 TaxID=3072141 RepID=UPI00280DDA96|nr:3-isopropylmalate dehydratase large subunit [Bradyrhizobium sp. LHD-71]MDQ8729141.1 3-isopropylmalate dehydratase large subunit [Bradyrhizobium sp. LHD-71]